MKIIISASDIDSLKRELGHLLPGVKSSHRVEAMARGLGWNTNAALRASLLSGPTERPLDQGAFSAYLSDHGVPTAGARVLESAVASTKFPAETRALNQVLEQNPDLANGGFGLQLERGKSLDECQSAFRDSRIEMRSLNSVSQFVRACEFLSQFSHRKSINPASTSYGMKHRAERFHRQRGAPDPYVSNGIFIAAALALGFKVQPVGINAVMNIGQMSKPGVIGKIDFKVSTALEHRRAPSGSATRQLAWRNMMLSAINAGLAQNLFGLDVNDNRWTGSEGIYELAIAGMPALARVMDAGFGELEVDVVLNPRKRAAEHLGMLGPSSMWSRESDGYASGWLERTNGKWLQTSSKPMCYLRREVAAVIAAASVVPDGYAPAGKFMM